jgi:potassium-transporting ATPase potassium-binding subunit
MVGRTPEYLGKKIEARDVKLAALMVLVTAFGVLLPTAWASVSSWGVAGLNNGGPHGLGEMLYYFSSATGNNGSAFAGLTTNTPWYNTLGGIIILIGCFCMIVPVMALAGSLVQKQAVAHHAGSYPVTSVTFVVLVVSTVLIVGALTFFPVLAFALIVEHILLHTTTTVF